MNAKRLALLAFAVALSAGGCRCQPPIETNHPDLSANPTAVSFSACPTKDENNMTVTDVFPDEQKISITNGGKAGATLTATLSGADMAQFKLDSTRTPAEIGAGDSVDLPIQFSPAKKGDVRATLTLSDGDETTDDITVDLTGTGKNLPAQPTIEAAIEDYASPGNFMQVCKEGSPGSDCLQGYPDTLLMDSSTLHIKLRNTGCPAIKVTGIELERAMSGANDSAFFLDAPTTLPSAQNPMVMSTADGTAEVLLTIRFAPQPEGSGDTQRISILTIKTNDPATPELRISLQGNGLTPSIYAVPSFCNFNDPNDRCRVTGAKTANHAFFEITNGGGTNVTLTSVKFNSSGSSSMGSGGRFTVMTPIDGTVLMPGQKATLDVEHHDQPLFVIDQLTVLANPASAGKIVLTVAGGTAPCLATDPDTVLDFNLPTTELTVKPVKVKALATRPGTGAPCGDLIIDGSEVATDPFFSIVPPLLDGGTRIAAGSEAQINVQYKKPLTGGRQAGELTIKTNDLDFAGPSYKKLLLQSDSPLNEIPVCVLKGCLPSMLDCSAMGSTGSMVVSLSQNFGPMKNVTLWGGDSSDPGNESMTNHGIAQWKYAVIPPSPNISGFNLPNNGVYTMNNSVVLTLDPAATGLYKLFLYVKDGSGQQSATACELRITVNQ
ncbi:MAG: choice-of-anchor D domain-containing protein [Archangiaceae bacterium]|nr:choice-of-anchor D domain-containing protein [Archangiaceae bacterium]